MAVAEERVFIAGAGPVGMTAAARLLRSDVPVTVFESGDNLSTESRASTFHPSTLDMLEELGAIEGLVRRNVVVSSGHCEAKIEHAEAAQLLGLFTISREIF